MALDGSRIGVIFDCGFPSMIRSSVAAHFRSASRPVAAPFIAHVEWAMQSAVAAHAALDDQTDQALEGEPTMADIAMAECEELLETWEARSQSRPSSVSARREIRIAAIAVMPPTAVNWRKR